MDTSKQQQTSTDEDTSDDLIAELARLVAQDARPGTGAAPQRTGPVLANERREPPIEAEPQARASATAGNDLPRAGTQAEPNDAGAGDDVTPAFDFGFGTAHKVAQAERGPEAEAPAQQHEHDPIADLIAGAEAEQHSADRDDAGDLFEAPPIAAGSTGAPTDPGMRATAYSSGRSDAGESERDPLSEIEALIGEAARVSAAGPGGRRVRSAFLGDEQDPQAIERAVDMAEDSMRVAKEARSRNGDAQRNVDPPMPDLTQVEFSAGRPQGAIPDDLDEETFVAPAPARRRSGGFLVPALAGAAIFVLLGGAYVLFFSPQPETEEPPVLTADASPLKEEPEDPAPASAANDSVVFNEMSGTASSEGEALVSRDETGGVTGNAVSNLITSEDGVGELVNRSVRTVTVRPDGTIVSSDDGVAGGSVLPVDRPNVPALSGEATGEDPIGDAIVAAIGGDTAAGSTPAATSDAGSAAITETETPTEAADPATGGDDPNAPQPIPRPQGLVAPNAATPSLAVTPSLAAPASDAQTETVASVDTPATATQPSAVTPAQTQPAAANTGTPPAAWVQLASQRSEEVARAGVSDLQARYGALFNGTVPEVSRVDLGDRGIYYRVRLPQPTLADANAVCDAIKGQGGDCFVLNN